MFAFSFICTAILNHPDHYKGRRITAVKSLAFLKYLDHEMSTFTGPIFGGSIVATAGFQW